jgi:bacteriocin-like protein
MKTLPENQLERINGGDGTDGRIDAEVARLD